jgi:glutathionylspermidine synthase
MLPHPAHRPDPPRLRLGRALEPGVLAELRRVMELRHFKWDAQVADGSSLAPHPLLLSHAAWHELAGLAERLFEETVRVEAELLARPSLHARLAVPRALRRLLASGAPTPAAARVMRFDFHPTADGWRVSEVNSDVPGGFTEATAFTALMAAQCPGTRAAGDPSRAVVDAIVGTVGEGATVALFNAPGHMEDHQVTAHLAAALRARRANAVVTSVQQLDWCDGRARVGGKPIDAVYRFYQSEWLPGAAPARHWAPLFVDGRTPTVNPGTSVLTESKRVPLVWDQLRTAVPTWRQLLPATRALTDAPWRSDDAWLIKSAYCNTGDTVFVRAHLAPREWQRAVWAARLRPSRWVAQRRFVVTPLLHERGALHPCIGVYVVDGRAAGAYGRVSRGPIIDGLAQDIAVLLEDDEP